MNIWSYILLVARELLVGLGAQGEQVAGVAVAHGQRIAALAVGQIEPAFEVDRPDLVRLRRLGEAVVERRIGPGTAPAAGAQPVAAQNPGNRAADRRRFQAVLGLEHDPELLGPPGAVQSTLGENQGFDLSVGAMRAAVRTVAASLEPLESGVRVAG